MGSEELIVILRIVQRRTKDVCVYTRERKETETSKAKCFGKFCLITFLLLFS